MVGDTTEKDKEKVNMYLDVLYDLFKDHVAKGRTLKQEDVEEHAQGRVWVGIEA
jgi:ClpP class serine protease